MATPFLKNFRATFNKLGGWARTNHFRVITLSPGGGDAVNMSTMCIQCTIPGISIETTDIREHGPMRTIPFSVSHEDITLVYRCTAKHPEYKYWHDWASKVVDHSGEKANHMKLGYYDDFTSSMRIEQLDTKFKTVLTVEVYEAYPTSVSSIQLNTDERDSIEQLTVTIAHRGWKYS